MEDNNQTLREVGCNAQTSKTSRGFAEFFYSFFFLFLSPPPAKFLIFSLTNGLCSRILETKNQGPLMTFHGVNSAETPVCRCLWESRVAGEVRAGFSSQDFCL